MAEPWLDDEGYPTEAAIAKIEQWPYQDIAGCLDFVQALWRYPDWATHDLTAHEGYVVRAEKGRKYLRLATGGWSGNEELVAALKANGMIHAIAWRLSARGGLHIYAYPQESEGR